MNTLVEVPGFHAVDKMYRICTVKSIKWFILVSDRMREVLRVETQELAVHTLYVDRFLFLFHLL
jgi:hypothetical protein